jgi:hypothetical protein
MKCGTRNADRPFHNTLSAGVFIIVICVINMNMVIQRGAQMSGDPVVAVVGNN